MHVHVHKSMIEASMGGLWEQYVHDMVKRIPDALGKQILILVRCPDFRDSNTMFRKVKLGVLISRCPEKEVSQ